MMALSRPPADPGGGVISVKTASERPLKPSYSSTPRISTSQPRPKAVAASDSTMVMVFLRRRTAERFAIGSPDPLVDARQHVARAGEHDEGDDEQDEAELDQRRGV